MNWYLGPLGDLRSLPVPEPGMDITQVRYGGTHQGLSGSRVQDTTGRRQEYTLDFKWLDKSEYYWLESMHSGHVPGPFRLIDPLKKNRFNNLATTMARSVGQESILTYDRSYPPAVPIPGRSFVLSGWTGSSYNVAFESRKGTVVLPAETVTASVYMRANASHAANLVMQMCDVNLNVIDTQSVAISATTTWERYSMTRTVPVNTAAVKFRVTLGSANTPVYFAAPQFESGSIATTWEPGGGAPVVNIDQMSVTSPRFGYRDVSLNLLEV